EDVVVGGRVEGVERAEEAVAVGEHGQVDDLDALEALALRVLVQGQVFAGEGRVDGLALERRQVRVVVGAGERGQRGGAGGAGADAGEHARARARAAHLRQAAAG